jgi:hypothetical protein
MVFMNTVTLPLIKELIMITLKFTIEEIFELQQALIIINNENKDLVNAYQKLHNVKMPAPKQQPNFDYTPPLLK